MAEQQRAVEFRVPTPAEDKVRFGKVGIIAVIGFAIGVAWPRLAGLNLVTQPPGYEKSSAVAASAEVGDEPALPAAAKSAAAAQEKPPETTTKQTVQVGEAIITSCRTADDRKLKECDKVGFDEVARARVEALAACDAAKGASGVLSLGIEFDFSEKRVRRFLRGKSTTLTEDLSNKILACAEKEFESAAFGKLDHQFARYIVFYPARFVPPGEPVAAESDLGSQEAPASGLATVGWDVALIRSAPKDGDVVARVMSGTRVSVTARLDEWYKVKYDSKGNEGWVYRAAIGL